MNPNTKTSIFQKALHKMKMNEIKKEKKNNEFYKPKGFWVFIKGMILINDDVMVKACSNDAYVYLLYLKWWAISLFMLSIIGIFFLCPFYYLSTSDPNATFLEKIKITGVMNSSWKMWIIFLISLIYSTAGYIFVYKFVLHFKEFLYYKEENSTLSQDHRAARRTVMILGIPDHLSVYESNKGLHKYFSTR